MPSEVVAFPVEKEYEKNPEVSREDIRKLRSWLQNQPHLPNEYISDLDLLLTYHCCDRSTAVTKDVLDLHYTLRTHFTSFFKDRDVDKKVTRAYEVTLLMPLKTRAHDGSAFFYGRLLDYDARNFVFCDVMKSVIMLLDLWQYEEGTWPGLQISIDMDRVSIGHLARLDVTTIQQFLYYLQEAMLVKLKAVHFLNAPHFMDKLMMMLKPFMKKQLLDMINIHQVGSDTLDKFIDKDALPKEPQYQAVRDEGWSKILSNRQFFVDENRKRVAENQRPGKPKSISDIFGGVEGSFKKLDID